MTRTHESENERAVSPVIGVILMVAITVILAAVIATFVLDLGTGVQEDAQAGVTIDGDEVSLTSMGNSDGVALVQDDGSCIEILDSVGQSHENSSTSSVVAFIGDDVNGCSDYPDDAEVTTVIRNVD